MKKYLILVLLPLLVFAEEPHSIWLTWEEDPTTTMTIHWLTGKDDLSNALTYKKADETESQAGTGIAINLPDGYEDIVHRVTLRNLEPNTVYDFSLNSSDSTWQFQTMPKDLKHPIRFIVGGDMYTGSTSAMRQTNREATKTDPLFVLIGGDIAYTGSRFWFMKEDADRWFTWLKIWFEEMRTEKGRLIPIVPVIGNHEVNGRFGQTPAQAKFFYTLFNMPENRAYRALDFSNYMTLVLLDSGHTTSIDGEQKEWLREKLTERKGFQHKFAAYHVPAYPSIRKEGYKHSLAIRSNWVPIFEENDLTVAFEHHDHSYKRTHKIRKHKKDPTGILYLGDGAWSPSRPRRLKYSAWYIHKQHSRRHFIVVDLSENERKFYAVSDRGNIIDHYEETTNPGCVKNSCHKRF